MGHTQVLCGVYRFSCAGPGPGLDPVGCGTGSGRLRVRPGPDPGPGPDAGPVPDQLRPVGCSGHRMLMEQERTYALGMDALVTACSWNTNGFMPWAWMLLSPYALGTRTDLCLGHGCSGHRMLLAHERIYALGMDALVTVCSWNTNGIMLWAWMLWSPYALGTRAELCFGHGCSGHSMVFEHERNYALGMDAPVTVCSWNTNGIMRWAWMLWSPYAL